MPPATQAPSANSSADALPIVTSVERSTHDYFQKQWKSFVLSYVLTAVLLALGLYAFIAYEGIKEYGDSNAFAESFPLIALPFLIPAFRFYFVWKKMETIFFADIAKTLNATYSRTEPVPSQGQLFALAHGGRFFNVFTMQYQGMPLRLGDYEYTVQAGKQSHTYPYTISELTVGNTLPRIICIPSRWTEGVLFSPWKPSGFISLSLEGSFNTYFTLYVAPGTEIEALQVFEPDLMAKLIDTYAHNGFECVGKTVYVYTFGRMQENNESILKALDLSKHLYDLLTPELRSFR